ncbi:MAG: restriction endonuclease subunit S [Acidimicrobiales bacterium]
MNSRYPLRPLGEVLTLDLDRVPVEPSRTYDIAGVYSFGRGLFAREPLPGSDTSYHVLNRLHAGELVLSRLKAFEGAVAVIPAGFDRHFLSQEFPTFSCVAEGVDPTYLGYLCRWPTFWEALAGTSKGVGARRERVHPEALLAIEIPLPDIEEQRGIAARLRTLDDRLDRAHAFGETSSRLARAIAPSLLNTSAGRRPVGELVQQVRREESVDPSMEYRLLGVRWYGEGLFIREQKMGDEVAAAKIYRVKQGDFVYNRLFAWKGSFAVVEPGLDDCHVSGEFPTFEVDHANLDVRYLLALFTDPAIWGLVEDRSTGGTPTSRNRLKEAAFLNLEIPVPPLPEQVRLAGMVDMVRATGLLRQHRGQYVEGLRASVLNQALAGLTQ